MRKLRVTLLHLAVLLRGSVRTCTHSLGNWIGKGTLCGGIPPRNIRMAISQQYIGRFQIIMSKPCLMYCCNCLQKRLGYYLLFAEVYKLTSFNFRLQRTRKVIHQLAGLGGQLEAVVGPCTVLCPNFFGLHNLFS
jgi:hypothetical protein